jgi:hypothetical protein
MENIKQSLLSLVPFIKESSLLLVPFILGAIAVFVLDSNNFKNIADWLKTKPLIAGLIINTISISLIPFFYEVHRKIKEAEQWNKVWPGILRETGFQATLFIEGMDYFLSGRHEHNVDSIFSDSLKDEMSKVLKEHNCIETDEEKKSEGLKGTEIAQKLEVLLEKENWKRLVCNYFDILKHKHYLATASSIQIMLQSDALRSQCNILADFMECIESMHIELATYTFNPPTNSEKEKVIERIIISWRGTVLLGVATHTIQMRRFAPRWEHSGRARSINPKERLLVEAIVDNNLKKSHIIHFNRRIYTLEKMVDELSKL